jgi:phosphoglycerate dehydrogenase-like enzyme
MASQTIAVLQEQGIPREAFQRVLKDNGNFTLVWKVTEEEVANTSNNENCVALITVNKPVNEAILNQYPNIKAVLVAFTGYGVHDLDLCKERNIAVYNVPDYSSSSVAELAIGLTLAVLRDIPKGDRVLRNGGWAFSAGGNDLRGKTVGIAGTGTIGIATAKIFNAFGCKLIGWSRSEKQEFKDLGGTYVSRKDLFSTADIVSLHIPNNKETKKMIGEEDFQYLREDSIFINTARGQICDQESLFKHLLSGKFRAGLDVYSVEPLPLDDGSGSSEIRKCENVVITPHVAYKTKEALTRRAAITAQNAINAISGDTTNKVA